MQRFFFLTYEGRSKGSVIVPVVLKLSTARCCANSVSQLHDTLLDHHQHLSDPFSQLLVALHEHLEFPDSRAEEVPIIPPHPPFTLYLDLEMSLCFPK